jgi:hypothetical protein
MAAVKSSQIATTTWLIMLAFAVSGAKARGAFGGDASRNRDFIRSFINIKYHATSAILLTWQGY